MLNNVFNLKTDIIFGFYAQLYPIIEFFVTSSRVIPLYWKVEVKKRGYPSAPLTMNFKLTSSRMWLPPLGGGHQENDSRVKLGA